MCCFFLSICFFRFGREDCKILRGGGDVKGVGGGWISNALCKHDQNVNTVIEIVNALYHTCIVPSIHVYICIKKRIKLYSVEL